MFLPAGVVAAGGSLGKVDGVAYAINGRIGRTLVTTEEQKRLHG